MCELKSKRAGSPHRLTSVPSVFQEGEQGYLEGLASRYADLFRTHYGDVLEPLEELRRRETNASPRMANTQLTTSHSQPIYVPGKYSVSFPRELVPLPIATVPARPFPLAARPPSHRVHGARAESVCFFFHVRAPRITPADTPNV